MNITLWLHTYSVIAGVSFSTTFVERMSGLGDLVYNYIILYYNHISPTLSKIISKYATCGITIFLHILVEKV